MYRHWNVDRIMQFIFALIIIAVSIFLLNYLSAVLVPFGAAFLLAYIVDPIVNRLQRKVRYRIVAVIMVLLSFAALFGLALLIFIPQITEEVQRLGSLLSKILTDSTWSDRLNEFLPGTVLEGLRNLISVDHVAKSMQSLDFWKDVQAVLSKVLPGALGFLSGTATVVLWLTGVVLIIMYLIFIMLDMPKLRTRIKKLVPFKYKEEAEDLAKEMDHFMASYFRAQTIVALSVGALFATVFSIIGFPMGFVFGLFIGALNMIPYLQLMSIPMALLLGVIYALDTGIPFWEVALILIVTYGTIQVIQDLVLVPNIIGKSMNLPPVGILLSLSVWGKLLGFLGLIVAIPFTCLCLVYLDKLQRHRDEQDLLLAAESEKCACEPPVTP